LDQQFKTPILFLIFNRPDTTEIVFESIRRMKPARLYIAADGPRLTKDGEKNLCEKTRAITNKIDWDCDVKKLFRNENLGCKMAVSSAISWFFENEEEGIILEDDCLPNHSFFTFCEAMLKQYRFDMRVMHISGSNFQDGINYGDGSYFFSKVHYIWGWATWRRAWDKYDISMSGYDSFLQSKSLKKLFPQRYIQQLWLEVFQKIRSGVLNTWDYQWTFSIWKENGLGITPNANLVSNIGFSNDATHTQSSSNDILANRSTNEMIEIVHPTQMDRDYAAEKYTLDKYIVKGIKNKIVLSIKNLLKRG